jgi:hypothetical protein
MNTTQVGRYIPLEVKQRYYNPSRREKVYRLIALRELRAIAASGTNISVASNASWTVARPT